MLMNLYYLCKQNRVRGYSRQVDVNNVASPWENENRFVEL